MGFDPVVIQVRPPRKFFRIPKLPTAGTKYSKIITASAVIVISLSMVSFAAFTAITNSKQFKKSHNIGGSSAPTGVEPQSSGSSQSASASPGGGVATGTGGNSGVNSPVVTLTAEPASINVGGTSELKWSVTNNPSSCIASEDWTGTKSPSGQEKTAVLAKVQTYLYTLTCKNATGTGFATVSVGATSSVTTGGPKAPTVTIAANPTSLFAGDSSTLTWSAANSPTSCTASGDWSGPKAATGPESTGPLGTVKTYSYTITCKNTAGSSTATATVQANALPPDVPVVFLASNPVGPVTPNSAVTLSWTVANTAAACTASGDWSGAKAAGGGSQSSGALGTIRTYIFNISCSNSSGSTFDSAAVVVLPNAPVVSVTVSPSTLFVGASATINWSASNSPSSCTASGDWSGIKGSSGSQNTGVLATAKTYSYSLTCTNAGGTGFANNIPLTVSLPPPPAVTLQASPITVTSGGSSTLTWSASNSPSSCTASGDWTGSKSTSGGSQSTGTLSTVRTYSYSLSCSNAGGTGSASTGVSVSTGVPAAQPPVVTVSVAPTTIGTGSSATLSWSATNNPTSCTASGTGGWSGSKAASGTVSTGAINAAGSYSYVLSCTNSAGTGVSNTASLTVIAIPVVSISVAPTAINTGGSTTISWSATNSPSSCTAGGSWSGSKAASGTVSTGAINAAGSYSYSLSCTNTGGTGTASATLTVTNQAPVYCGGLTTCYGVSDLAAHAGLGNCWAWNSGTSASPWVFNITSFRPNHPGGGTAGTLEGTAAIPTCNKNINSILGGGSGIDGYKDKNKNSTFNHSSGTKNNSSGSGLNSYRLGYYDASKP